jgi:CheY-like chemotaxis protein
MVQKGIIKPDDVVVVNVSGHTLPVETSILGEQWQQSVDLSVKSPAPVLPEEGLLSALEQVDSLVRRIVVIEDNRDAARLIKRILEAKGSYDVHVANDGATGIELVRKHRPELVITDLMMPNVDGFTVIDTLKADPEMSRIPIVVVTAKELTAKERARLGGQISMLLQKGSFIDEEFVENLVNKLD